MSKRKTNPNRKTETLQAQARGWRIPRKVKHGQFHERNIVIYECSRKRVT